ncbi:RUN and FYVE domain-containing protein 2 isoform X4 [Octopus bimaculoides]|uniref:RUN and FYVE domain-containing protein 2 isoform X4 n=1 Tax=Octopus bimaculoides TaxID=37653 RepID=UPI0022E2E8CA|nr:RUN and FYVE domain-containing protein 2 isoform X4 [Octopus bimaculoides]
MRLNVSKMAASMEVPSDSTDVLKSISPAVERPPPMSQSAGETTSKVQPAPPPYMPAWRRARYERRDPRTIERANLLNVSKLIIKELIDSSLSHGRMLDDDHVPLQQFFVVLEHVLRHGLKPKKGILRDKREFWGVLEVIEKFAPEAAEITTSVREMPNIKTPLGRARAWLRLALMQKTLADYFKLIIEKKDDVLSEFYERGAIMVEDEGIVITGLLVGLNVIDCNLCIKEEDLDQPMGVIDFSLYLRDNKVPMDTPDSDSAEGKSKMATILDQKNYLEELNRHLNATVTNLQQKLESVQTTNALMKEDLAITKNTILTLQEENSTIKKEKDILLNDHKRKLELTKQDIDIERETYQTSRAGLDSLVAEAKKRLEDETQTRIDVERELELQISMKTEMEMALRLLEKDIHEKQDNIISMRKQLEDIKTLNLEMYKKLQTCDSNLKQKTEVVAKLEEKTEQLVNTLREMEKKSALETDLRIEREWRGTLQKTLEQERHNVTLVQMELQQMKEIQKGYSCLERSHLHLQQTVEEQEVTLAELGTHLSQTPQMLCLLHNTTDAVPSSPTILSKLKMEDMKEAQSALREAQWASDRDSKQCKQCSKQFSVSRRKHHCRNCGFIFCNECSDNKMPLPSSARPGRVCDSCHTFLLQRYSAT